MTRKELADLITLKLVAKATIPNTHDFWQLRTELVDVLWPVLATAWSEGYEAGYNDGAAEQGMGWEPEENQNPYEDVSA